LEAKQAGLLSSELLEEWLRAQLKAQKIDALFRAADRMSAVDGASILSPEAIAAEIAAMRAERHIQSGR
jgi:hypothetical protein